MKTVYELPNEYVICSPERFEELIRSDSTKAQELAKAEMEIDRLNDRILSIIDLIDDEAEAKMISPEKYAEPYAIKIELIAKLIGLDWEDYMNNWREDRKKLWEENHNEE